MLATRVSVLAQSGGNVMEMVKSVDRRNFLFSRTVHIANNQDGSHRA
jgi:hypothetical protein